MRARRSRRAGPAARILPFTARSAARQETLRQTSSQLPLYVGLGVAGVAAVAVGVVLVRRKLRGSDRSTYRRRKP